VRSLSWNWFFTHPVPKVWEWITNTDRLNRSLPLPAVKFTNEPDPNGGAFTFGEFSVWGLKLRWREHPYHWVYHRSFEVEREYLSGPLRYMKVAWRLDSAPGEGCEVIQTISYRTRSWIFEPIAWLQMRIETRRGFLKAYRRMEKALSELRTAPEAVFAPLKGDLPGLDDKRREQLVNRLKQAGVSTVAAPKLIQLAFEAQPPDVTRIRPFVMARQWSLEPLEVLVDFLRASKAGVFELYWDLICPSCQGAKTRIAELARLPDEAHCGSCNLKFGANFDESIEVSFVPHPSLRTVPWAEFCVGGPANTRHRLTQLRIPPKGRVDFEQALEPGGYRVRSPQTERTWLIEVGDEGEESARIDLSRVDPAERALSLQAGRVAIQVFNPQPNEALFILEEAGWRVDACTGSMLLSIQEFRDLFPTQVLKTGQEIQVSSMTLMFTDIKDSAALYQRVGDARAFEVVSRHFEVLVASVRKFRGSLVKTIGDSVMASFFSPEDAVLAALDMQTEIAKLPAKDAVLVKIGAHCGPVFVVNRNERLDYFGTTVNLAARVLGAAEGGEIVLTGEMVADPLVQELLVESGRRTDRIVRQFKGFEGAFELHRVL
jgi:class 3 adenylate cyclase